MINKTLKGLIRTLTKVVVTVAILLVVIFVIQTAFNFGLNLTNHTKDEVPRDIAVEIPEGATTKIIANTLENNGVINNAFMFVLGAKMNGYDGRFKYGSYILNTTMSDDEIMEILITQGAKATQIKITIPEGYSVYQIADMLEEKGICTADEFIQAANKLDYDYDFMEYIQVREDEKSVALEGYLFPDTYFVAEDATAEDVVNTLLTQFDEVFTSDYYRRAKQLGYTIDEIITMASVIEREAKINEERPKMASVIYNRLDQGITLGMCSTILYAQGRVGEPVTRLLYEDLEIKSPYNTYKNAGLPLGPISNPGKKSIEAALYPDKTDYLYFVLINEETGEHHFSTTLDEQDRKSVV